MHIKKITVIRDRDIKYLTKKTCAIIGFGSQGCAQALNLRDNGITPLIGLYPKSNSSAKARKHGFQIVTTAEAVQQADIICLALPDLKIPTIFANDIAPHLASGKTLLFLHGFVLHYQTIQLPHDINVVMVSPKGGPGPSVRQQFLAAKPIPSAIAVHHDFSDDAKKIALAWAKGIGGKKNCIIETTCREETESNLFAEQTLLCGGISALLQRSFETLIESGIQPELAYLSTLHEIKLTVDLIHQCGISGMRSAISETAKYGDLTVGPTIIDNSVKKKMQRALKNIQSGKFTKAWLQEYQSGLKNYTALLQQGAQHPLETTSKKMREAM